MNVSTDQRPGGTTVIKAVVSEADYAPEVEKALREYRRKANIPGFRPGMVPMGVINNTVKEPSLNRPTAKPTTPCSNTSKITR